MFKSTLNKGFQITFENGWTISVQFGFGNYCSKKQSGYKESMESDIWSSDDAEIAIWDKEGNWYNFGNDEVKGFCSADEVAEWIQFTSKQPA